VLTAHLPAGYLSTKSAARLADWTRQRPHYRRLFAAGLAISVLPDADLLYYYLIDGRQHRHHGYLFHVPAFWAVVSVALVSVACVVRSPAVRVGVAVFMVNIFGHLALDSVSSKIAWLYPLKTARFGLFTVPAHYNWWVWSFMLHWTFLLEVIIWSAAAGLFFRERKRACLPAPVIK
jgi:inner membrane protein